MRGMEDPEPVADVAAFEPLDMDVQAAAREYSAGATLEELAARYGIPPSTVRARLVKAGTPLRATGPRTRGMAGTARPVSSHVVGRPTYGGGVRRPE